MSEKRPSRAKRVPQPMPPFIRKVLEERNLLAAYRARPAYQQNDYLAWINRAKRKETKYKRLAQMLFELQRGDRYMNMPYPTPSDRGEP